MNNLERHRADLKNLLIDAAEMKLDLAYQRENSPESNTNIPKDLKERIRGKFDSNYQNWYSESSALMAQILPQRLVEFNSYYLRDPKRKKLDMISYTIQDWLLGIRSAIDKYNTGTRYFEDQEVMSLKFESQIRILNSVERRFESSLFDINQLLRADLFDSELDAANELLKHKFTRAAGALAGVVLEKHLKAICEVHQAVVKKARPTISTLNDALKDIAAIDIPMWRFIQHLGDLRNLCDHDKDREPTESEVADLIAGTKKVSMTVH